jgi:hypothetical protein
VKHPILAMVLVVLSGATPIWAQNIAPDAASTDTTLRINSRAVLVDVIVTDHNGAPVAGLARDAFTVTEQGKPQAMSFFEEHKGTPHYVESGQTASLSCWLLVAAQPEPSEHRRCKLFGGD